MPPIRPDHHRRRRGRRDPPDRPRARRQLAGRPGPGPPDPARARCRPRTSRSSSSSSRSSSGPSARWRPRLSGRMSRIASSSFQEQTEKRLALAGNPGNLRVADWLGIKAVGAVVGAHPVRLPVRRRRHPGPAAGPADPDGASSACCSATRSRSSGSAAASRSASTLILLQIPDALDLLTISVRAGLGFDAALGKVVEKLEGPLSTSSAGRWPRSGSARRAARRCATSSRAPRSSPLTNFIGAIIQAEQLGVSICKVLQVQSEQLRIERRQRAEERPPRRRSRCCSRSSAASSRRCSSSSSGRRSS